MASEEWRPGSFTKNFSWGNRAQGLRVLHEMIRLGFDGNLQDVPRDEFRKRVQKSNRPDYIALNFFLFNRGGEGTDYVVADELVFQALTSEHSTRFDKLALFAFNFSYVGRWKGSASYQKRPALWAFHYIADRLRKVHGWNTSRVSADDIESFVKSDRRYTGETTRKLATNLNYLYSIGHLEGFASQRVERWWVDALFLALDRLIEDRAMQGKTTSETQYSDLLKDSRFLDIAGRSSLEKTLAQKHLTDLYIACGGVKRFSDDFVRDRTKLKIPDVRWLIANNSHPQGAVHPSNPAILKTIPRSCAFLARYSGFEVIAAEELENFDAAEFVHRHTIQALKYLQEQEIRPQMSAEELQKLTRGT